MEQTETKNWTASDVQEVDREQLQNFQNRRFMPLDWLMPKFMFLCAILSVATTIGLIYTLIGETIEFFKVVPILDFITGTKWAPLFEPRSFGVLPLVMGTFEITFIACIFAFPIGIACAIYLSEYASDRFRKIVKPILEILAGIPTIVLGYFALFFLTPLLREIWPDMNVFNALSAGICVGIMVIPMISSLSEDAMSAVPKKLREGAYGLGATKYEVATKIVFPAAISGIVSSFVLAFSRAVGETMIVAVAAGATPRMEINPLDSVQTMTAYIVAIITGEPDQMSIEYKTVYSVGILLFVITLVLNIFAMYVARKVREEY